MPRWAQNSVSNNICLSINISPKQLQDPGFFDKTLEIVRQYPLERIHIVLEHYGTGRYGIVCRIEKEDGIYEGTGA